MAALSQVRDGEQHGFPGEHVQQGDIALQGFNCAVGNRRRHNRLLPLIHASDLRRNVEPEFLDLIDGLISPRHASQSIPACSFVPHTLTILRDAMNFDVVGRCLSKATLALGSSQIINSVHASERQTAVFGIGRSGPSPASRSRFRSTSCAAPWAMHRIIGFTLACSCHTNRVRAKTPSSDIPP